MRIRQDPDGLQSSKLNQRTVPRVYIRPYLFGWRCVKQIAKLVFVVKCGKYVAKPVFELIRKKGVDKLMFV